MSNGHADATEELYIQQLEERLKQNPNDVEALIHKAVMFYEPYHREKEGDKILQSVIEKDPKNVDAYLWRAELLYFTYKDYYKAVELLETALSLDPHRADCHAVLGGVLSSDNDTQRAEYHYRKAFELEPTYIGPRRFLADILFRKGEGKQARYELEEALKYLQDKWPIINPVQGYYEGYITGRCFFEGRKTLLEFITRIDAAEAASKLQSNDKS